MIIAILIATNIIHVFLSILATAMFINLLNDEVTGSLVSTIVITVLVFLFSEIIPKNIASKNSYENNTG